MVSKAKFDSNPFAGAEAAVIAVFDSSATDLLSLARKADLDPGTDFRYADLRQLDLRDEDLSRFDFHGADLRGANLSNARIYRSGLDGAILDGAQLENAHFIEEGSSQLWGGPEGWELVRDTRSLPNALLEVSPIDGRHVVSEETTEIRRKRLPWYRQKVTLFALNDRSAWPKRLTIYFVMFRGSLYRLNGTSPPIHELNAIADIDITEETLLDYLRFFSFFVRGDEGPFYIAESIDDPAMPQDMDPTTRSVVEGTVRPASFEGLTKEGNYACDAVVFYSNALFIANFEVQKSGMCEMTNDEPIAGDLTARIDQPIA